MKVVVFVASEGIVISGVGEHQGLIDRFPYENNDQLVSIITKYVLKWGVEEVTLSKMVDSHKSTLRLHLVDLQEEKAQGALPIQLLKFFEFKGVL